MFKSKLKLIKNINWNQSLNIQTIEFDSNLINFYKQKMHNSFPNMSDIEIDDQINQFLLKDKILNTALSYIKSFYSIEYDEGDIHTMILKLKNDLNINNNILEMAQNIIFTSLIYNDIQKQFNINVDKDELKQLMNNYNIDKTQLEDTKKLYLDEKITNFIINKLNIKYE